MDIWDIYITLVQRLEGRNLYPCVTSYSLMREKCPYSVLLRKDVCFYILFLRIFAKLNIYLLAARGCRIFCLLLSFHLYLETLKTKKLKLRDTVILQIKCLFGKPEWKRPF